MKTNTLNERIVLRMRDLNIKSKDLVRATGASKGTVSQWVNGGNEPSAKYVASLATILGVNEKWLLQGGPVFNKKDGLDLLRSSKRIPLLSLQQAGAWSDIMDNELSNVNTWIETTGDTPRFSFAIRVEGDSMVQTGGSGVSLSEGAVVIVDPERRPFSGAIVAARLANSDSITIKKLIIDGPNIYLVSLNQNYKSIQIESLKDIIGVCIRTQMELV
ncbi:LexA family protein [Candidatus Regiella endosymbiont of Tuberolachnus salignus]|uniref:LexA family protein n=1 Tax=Candidatus Regiella endosymbiont of Tuberolachnus salignus TaxID=3077956 RepID=UPI0030D110E9